jgi:hypothetical protein
MGFWHEMEMKGRKKQRTTNANNAGEIFEMGACVAIGLNGLNFGRFFS